jgi:hypothetical protein
MSSSSPPPQRQQTQLETEEDISRLLHTTIPAPGSIASGEPFSLAAPASGVKPYRPTLRPPTALVTVLDDGKNDGEVIRIRTDRFVIGRKEGDYLISHDPLISGRHIEITRQKLGNSYRWVVADLQTTNGLFVRVSRIVLASGAEFLVGQGRYRFEMSVPSQQATTVAPGGDFGSTQLWGSDASALLGGASLMEVVPGGSSTRVVLTQGEYWIGSDPACAIRRIADPFVEPRHVRLARDGKGAWQAQHNKALNGLWLRVPQITVEDSCTFQIGEQRLRLKVGG